MSHYDLIVVIRLYFLQVFQTQFQVVKVLDLIEASVPSHQHYSTWAWVEACLIPCRQQLLALVVH